MNCTSQEPTPEDAWKDGYIHGLPIISQIPSSHMARGPFVKGIMPSGRCVKTAIAKLSSGCGARHKYGVIPFEGDNQLFGSSNFDPLCLRRHLRRKRL